MLHVNKTKSKKRPAERLNWKLTVTFSQHEGCLTSVRLVYQNMVRDDYSSAYLPMNSWSIVIKFRKQVPSGCADVLRIGLLRLLGEENRPHLRKVRLTGDYQAAIQYGLHVAQFEMAFTKSHCWAQPQQCLAIHLVAFSFSTDSLQYQTRFLSMETLLHVAAQGSKGSWKKIFYLCFEGLGTSQLYTLQSKST